MMDDILKNETLEVLADALTDHDARTVIICAGMLDYCGEYGIVAELHNPNIQEMVKAEAELLSGKILDVALRDATLSFDDLEINMRDSRAVDKFERALRVREHCLCINRGVIAILGEDVSVQHITVDFASSLLAMNEALDDMGQKNRRCRSLTTCARLWRSLI